MQEKSKCTFSLIQPLLCNVQHQAIFYTNITYNDKLGSSLLFKFSHKLQSILVPHVGCKLDIYVMKTKFCIQWYSSSFYLLLRCMHIGQGLNFKKENCHFRVGKGLIYFKDIIHDSMIHNTSFRDYAVSCRYVQKRHSYIKI